MLPHRRADREPSGTGRLERFTYGVVAGLVAAGLGLGTAELTTATSARLQSPVIDVGDRVVDGVPNWLKTQAIEWFGQNDKRALLIGIGILLALYAAALGIVSLTRRWPVALAGAAAFGVAGAYASQSSRRPAPWWAVAPSLVGGAVAAATLVLLRRALLHRRSAPAGGAGVDGGPELERRVFLAATGSAATLAVVANVVGRELVGRRSVVAEPCLTRCCQALGTCRTRSRAVITTCTSSAAVSPRICAHASIPSGVILPWAACTRCSIGSRPDRFWG